MPLVNGPLDWSRYRTVVFDVDGTLYDQRALRTRMLLMMAQASLKAGNIRGYLMLSAFRKVREDLAARDADDFLLRQYELTAERCGWTAREVRDFVSDWMLTRPLVALPDCVYGGVAGLFQTLRANGKTIAILSDYPAVEKLVAMGLRADIVVCAEDAEVGRLKPNPRGLLRILSETGARSDECLMIGDRADRDGEAAARCGVRALIRSRRKLPQWDTFRDYRDEIFGSVTSHTP
jgi:phosphoglycolate phosphatase/putative hydrolase of the HAD superfamily